MAKVVTPKNFISNIPKVVKPTENFKISEKYLQQKQTEEIKNNSQRNRYLDKMVIDSRNPGSAFKQQEQALKAKTTIPSVSYDAEYVKELQLKKDMEDAEKEWEDWKKSDYPILAKGLDYIGSPGVAKLKSDYKQKEEAYLKQKSIATESKIQKEYGITGDEYIQQLKEKKNNAKSDGEKDFYKKQLKSIRTDLYGKSNVFKHVGNIVKEGAAQVNKGVMASLDFLLGQPLNLLGFENNFFSQINQLSEDLLGTANEETYKSAQYLGDTKNISQQAGVALIAAVPDLLITAFTGGGSKTVQIGSKLANPSVIDKVLDIVKKTVKSPIFYSSFIQQLGVNYEENLESGASEGNSALAALLASAITARMEMGGFQDLPDELADTKGFWKKMYKWALSGIEEGLEEPGQTSATNLINKIVYDKDKKLVSTTDDKAVFNVGRAAKEFAIGTFVGGVLGGAQISINEIVNAKTNNQYKSIGEIVKKSFDVNEIINYAKSSKNDQIRTIAREVNANTVSDSDIGRIYQSVVSNINEEIDDIYTEKDLEELAIKYAKENLPQSIKSILGSALSNKLIEMNIEPESNDLYNNLTVSSEPQPSTENQPLQTDSEGGIIANEQITDTEGDNNGSTNTELLAGRKVSAVSGSGNGVRQQSENSRALSDRLGSFSAPSGDSNKSVQAGSEGWLVRRGQTSEIWGRLKEGLYRKLSRVTLKDIDSSGRKLSEAVQKDFADTILKNEDGTIISIFHYTQNEFDEFEYGDIGFHGGTLQASFDRQDQNAELGKPHYLKEMYARVTNPLFFESDGGVWDAEAVASRAKTVGVITQNEYDYLEQLEGFHYGKYSDEASVETRRILKEKGYDGIIYINEHEDVGSLSVIVFDAEQFLTVAENGVLKENSGVTEADPNGPANFMPEGENGKAESGGIGLSEPTTKEIYRDPTEQEQNEAIFGKRKDAKQRHIIDVAKKLDSSMTVVFVDPDNEKLSGRAGVFMHNTNTMYLSNDNSVVGMYCQLFKHEFVHRLESKGAYQSFKNYLLKHSSAFENYVRAKLKAINGTEFDGTREEALKAFSDYYISLVQNGDFTAEYKRNFTVEYAEREMVADFVGEVLFKGKENYGDVAQSLADGEIDEIISLEDTFAEFESLNETERNWFQRIIDTIKDWIASLKGIKQNERLVNDLEYIEKRLSRVLNSKDTKKAASGAVDRQYDIAVLENGNTYVKASRNVINGTTLSEQRNDITNFFKKLLKNKPSIDIHTIEGDVLTLTMADTEDKARDNYKLVNGNPVRMSQEEFAVKLRVESHIDEIAETAIKENKPLTPDEKKHDFAKDGFEYRTAYFEDFDNKYYKIRFSIGHNGTVATVYNIGKIKEDVPSSAKLIAVVGSRALDGSSSNDIILNEEDSVNNNISEEDENYSDVSDIKQSFSLTNPAQQQRENLKRYENGEMTREEYLEETDKLWGEANETYGMIPQGENAKAPIATPRAIAEDKPTERFIRTIIETGKLTDEMLEGIEEKVLLGDFAYEVISDEAATKKADAAIKNGTAEDIWNDTVNDGKRINKNQIAIGEKLLVNAVKNKDTKRVLELSSELADILTRAGQAVQASKLLKKMTGIGRLMSAQRTVRNLNKDLRKKYGEDFPSIKISEKAATRLANAKTEKGIEHAHQELMQEVADQVPVTFMDKWNAWRYFAMLSNPKTHIMNFFGNAIFTPAVRIKDAIAVGIEAATIKDKDKRTKSLIIKKEYRDFAKKDSARNDVKQLLKGNKYNDKSAIKEKQKIFKTEALNFLTEFNSNALEAEDMLFKNKHYIHALAGFLQARGVDINSVSEDVLTDARIYAVNEARKATFNDESALADAVQRFGNKNLAANLLVEGVLPFKRTPINIVKRGIEYSPIGLGKTITKGVFDLKKGKITATEFIDGLASGLTGTGIMLVGMFLANLGCISGGEDDDEKSQFEKLLGKQEYAVEILGSSYTIDWVVPACIPFFIGVEIVNTLNEGEAFELSQIGNAVWNSLEPITNLSMLSGIQGVIESARYADSAQTLSAIAVDSLTSYAMQGIPSLSGAVARTIDPTQRSWYIDKNDKWFDSTAQTVKNNIQSKVPGLSYTQIPKIDMWGREVSRGGVGERVLENFISPGYYSEIEYNEASEELKRIFNETDIDVFPNIAAKSFELNGETKHLTANEYVTYAKAKGEYSFEYITELMEASSYKKLTDEEKADVIEGLYEYANAKAKTTVSEYDLMKRYKTVTNWERNGRSAVDYYIYKAISK